MFSFGSRPSESAAFKVPGPGSYDQKSSVVGVPSSKFGLAQRSTFGMADKTPGPGAYTAKRPSTAPKYGFGTSERANFAGGSKIPGPGAYEYAGDFQRSDSKGVSIARRVDHGESSQLKVPGPGAYNPYKADK